MASEINRERRVEFEFRLLISDLQGDAALSDYKGAFHDKLAAVQLMYSLCKAATEKLQKVALEESKESKVVMKEMGHYRAIAAAYLEAFLYFIMGAFDVLAGITLYLYPKDQKALSKRYFKDQMNNFLQSNIDRDYAKLLSNNKDWIDDVSENRDALAHKASAFLGFDKERVVFVKRKPYDEPFGKKPSMDLLAFLDSTYKNIYDFLESYVKIHRIRIPESQLSKMMLDQLKRGLITEHIQKDQNQ